ncbi:protease complex subunit PrcB family protein, partial [Meiothermus sp. PNK-Is4]
RASRAGAAIVVRGQRAVRSAWVYDKGWSRLTPQDGQNLLTPDTPRLEGLSEAENAAVLQEVLARRGGKEVVLYQLAQPVLPALGLEPAPQNYRITAVEVQYGLESEGAIMGGNSSEVRVLRQGASSAYTDSAPQAFLATSASSFAQLWALATGNILPRPAAPEVNFSRYSIAAFFVGQKPTGGYGVRFVGATSSAGNWRITVELLQPAPGTILTQALTSPYLILELPGAASQVEFVDASGRLLGAATAR